MNSRSIKLRYQVSTRIKLIPGGGGGCTFLTRGFHVSYVLVWEWNWGFHSSASNHFRRSSYSIIRIRANRISPLLICLSSRSISVPIVKWACNSRRRALFARRTEVDTFVIRDALWHDIKHSFIYTRAMCNEPSFRDGKNY